MPDNFELETRDGFRKVEFDPDVFRARDVRILVDGERVAELRYPRPASPYHEVAFELAGHAIVGVAHLSAEPGFDSMGLRYDLFADDQSLTDGVSLADAHRRAPGPGEAYPARFRVIDAVLHIAPAASAPGMTIALMRRAGEFGWPMVIGLLAVMLGAVWLATSVAGRAWARIRGEKSGSVSRRAALGCAAVLGCYLVAGTGVLVLAALIGLANR